MPLLANVVFPLFDWPYMAGIFSPAFAAGALASEVLVFYAFQFRAAPFLIGQSKQRSHSLSDNLAAQKAYAGQP